MSIRDRIDLSATVRTVASFTPKHERLRTARLTAKQVCFPIPRSKLALRDRRRLRRKIRAVVLRALSLPVYTLEIDAVRHAPVEQAQVTFA